MLTAEVNGAYGQDFDLESAVTGTITGTVAMTGAGVTDFQSADISFRQSTDCGSGLTVVQIEVKAANVENGGSYKEDLPQDGVYYTLVASTEGSDTQIQSRVTTGSSFDLTFDVPIIDYL
jgi:hypothetical protein